MHLFEKEFSVVAAPGYRDLLAHIPRALDLQPAYGAVTVRFVVISSGDDRYQCEVGAMLVAGR